MYSGRDMMWKTWFSMSTSEIDLQIFVESDVLNIIFQKLPEDLFRELVSYI